MRGTTAGTAGSKWVVLVAVTLVTFITSLDNLIVNVALPSIERDLALSLTAVEWVVGGYIIAFGGLMLAGGKLADLIGRRTVLLIGIVVFTLASLVAGLANGDGLLITARVIQGVGAALATPPCLATIGAVFSDERERGLAVAVWTAVSGLALVVGPIAGGLISQFWDWHGIFLVNVPVGVVVVVLTLLAVPESRRGDAPRSLDAPGLVTSAVAMLALTFALIESARYGWGSAPIIVALLVAVVAGTAFVAVERRSAAPMVDTWFFTDRLFSGGAAVQLTSGLAFAGVLVYTSLYLQNVAGFRPVAASLVYLPLALAMVVFAPIAPRVAAVLGGDRTGALGFGLATVGLLLLALLGEHPSFAAIVPIVVLVGAGIALSTALTSVVLGWLPQHRADIGSSILNACREIAGLLGIALVGAVITGVRSAGRAAGRDPSSAFLGGYHVGLVVCAAFVAAAAVISLFALHREHSPVDAVDEQPEPA